MAIPTINFKGFLYDDAGDAISGATVNLYAKNSTTTSLMVHGISTTPLLVLQD